MLYIITEDSNSSRSFWNIVARTFRGDGNYKLMEFIKNEKGGIQSGNTTLNEQFDLLIPKLIRGDEVFIAFDNVAQTNHFNPANFIRKAAAICDLSGVNLKISARQY